MITGGGSSERSVSSLTLISSGDFLRYSIALSLDPDRVGFGLLMRTSLWVSAEKEHKTCRTAADPHFPGRFHLLPGVENKQNKAGPQCPSRGVVEQSCPQIAGNLKSVSREGIAA